MIDRIADWTVEVVEAFGYVGVAFLVAVESIFPPIPSEIVLGLAGFVSSRGEAWIVGMILAATVGSLIGAYVLYGLAAAFGEERLRAIVRRFGRWVRITEHDLDIADRWFDRHSTTAVLVCRCIPLVRSLISVPAGFRRMSLVPFTLYTAAGSLVWNTLFITGGYLLGERWEQLIGYADVLQFTVVGVAILALAWFAWKRWLPRHVAEHERRIGK